MKTIPQKNTITHKKNLTLQTHSGLIQSRGALLNYWLARFDMMWSSLKSTFT